MYLHDRINDGIEAIYILPYLCTTRVRVNLQLSNEFLWVWNSCVPGAHKSSNSNMDSKKTLK